MAPSRDDGTAKSAAKKPERTAAAKPTRKQGKSTASSSQSPAKSSSRPARSSGRVKTAAAASSDGFSQPKLNFSSKPRADHDSYFASPSPPCSTSSSPQKLGVTVSANASASSSTARRLRPSMSVSPRKPAPGSGTSPDEVIVISTDSESEKRSAVLRASISAQPTQPYPSSSELWVDKYAPRDTTTLALHRAKLEQVRSWLREALDGSPALRAYRRLLVLTGPSGAGKSATIRALAAAQELDFDIVEWENVWGNLIGASLPDVSTSSSSSWSGDNVGNAPWTRVLPQGPSATQSFADFLLSSSRFSALNMHADDDADIQPTALRTESQPMLSTSTPSSQRAEGSQSSSQRLMPPPPAPRMSAAAATALRQAGTEAAAAAAAASSSQPADSSQPASSSVSKSARRIILLDDLPNLSHPPTRAAFQSTLATLLTHTQAQAKQYAAAERAARLSASQGSSRAASSLPLPPPIVLLLSDSTGRDSDASVANDALAGRTGAAFAWRRDEELSMRTVLGEDLRRDPRVSEIKFNPVAPTILKKALTRILDLVHADALTSSKGTTRSTSSQLPGRKGAPAPVKRDKALETELARLLAADESGVPSAPSGETSVRDQASSLSASENSKKNQKRAAIERPTGGDLRSAITQMQFVLEHQAWWSQPSAASADRAVGSVAGVKRGRNGAIVHANGKEKGKETGRSSAVPDKLSAAARAQFLLQTVSRRESNLPLFHAVGRVLWNKRVGDPGASDDEDASAAGRAKKAEKDKAKSTTGSQQLQERKRKAAKDAHEGESADDDDASGPSALVQKQSLASRLLAEDGDDGTPWPDLPSHLADLQRRPSKVNTEALWAQSPVDSSLFQLYLHQNFPSFCAEVEECSAGLEYISAADSDLHIWTESWAHASLSAYYNFIVSVGGILLSLPSPIPPVRTDHTSASSAAAAATPSLSALDGRTRHRQIRTSSFFDALRRTKESGEALLDAQEWLLRASSVQQLVVGGASAERSCLSTVAKTALAVEVVPLLAKLGGGAGDARTQSARGNGRRGGSSVHAAAAGAMGSLPPCFARVGRFDHLTVAQAMKHAQSLRTDALDDSGGLSGPNVAVGEDDEGPAGAPGLGMAEWREQVKQEEDEDAHGDASMHNAQAGLPSLASDGPSPLGRQALTSAPIDLDEGASDDDDDLGLMDSSDEVLDSEW